MKKRYISFLVLIMLLAIGFASIYFASGAKFMGFLERRGGGEPGSRPAGKPGVLEEETKKAAWWCMTIEEWNDLNKVTPGDSVEEDPADEGIDGAPAGTEFKTPGSQVYTPPGFKIDTDFKNRPTVDNVDPGRGARSEFNNPWSWVPSWSDWGDSGGDGGGVPVLVVPNVESGSKDSPTGGPDDGDDAPNNKTYIFTECGCKDKKVYVEQLGKTVTCPKYGHTSVSSGSNSELGEWELWVSKQYKVSCFPEDFTCPDGYVKYPDYSECSGVDFAWDRICDKDFDQKKFEECEAFIGATVTFPVEWSSKYLQKLGCLTKDQCADYIDQIADGTFNEDDDTLFAIFEICESIGAGSFLDFYPEQVGSGNGGF